MQVDPLLVSWITDYLTDRPQFVRLGTNTSDTVTSSTGAPQGTVLAPLLFTLYTADFRHNTELCHVQKFSDDTAIVGCIRGGDEGEYRALVSDFVSWSQLNHLQLNTSKTKELIVDFRRRRPSPQPVNISGEEIEVVSSYKYLGLQVDEKLDWSTNTDVTYKKTQSRLYFLRRLASFGVCRKMLQMFYNSVVASTVFYGVVCWGGNIRQRDTQRLDKLIKKAASVIGASQDFVVSVMERRTLAKLLSIMDNSSHPLHELLLRQRSSFSERLLSLSCSTDRLRKSFLPRAIRLFNASV